MLKPLFDNVVLQKEEAELKTASGIILTSADKNASAIAKVIAVGEGKIEADGIRKPSVAVGDRVIYREYAGSKVTYENEEYLVLREEDILAVIE